MDPSYPCYSCPSFPGMDGPRIPISCCFEDVVIRGGSCAVQLLARCPLSIPPDFELEAFLRSLSFASAQFEYALTSRRKSVDDEVIDEDNANRIQTVQSDRNGWMEWMEMQERKGRSSSTKCRETASIWLQMAAFDARQSQRLVYTMETALRTR